MPEIEKTTYQDTLAYAKQADAADPLARFRDMFNIPKDAQGNNLIYLCGNSLGLQPKKAQEYVAQELSNWADIAVEGHFKAAIPWTTYHEVMREPMAAIVGAKPEEVVLMNTLSTNLHLMMVSFYRPTAKRYKILIESDAFPSDSYAVKSQIKEKGYDPEEGLILWQPREGEHLNRFEDLEALMAEHGEEIALIMVGNSNYYTGQKYPIKEITQLAKNNGSLVLVDACQSLAHTEVDVKDLNIDFLAGSGHKLCGPTGIGFLWSREEILDRMPPLFGGGEMIQDVFEEKSTWADLPHKFEAGTPAIAEAIGLSEAINYINKLGLNNIQKYEKELTEYLFEKLVQSLHA